jgi:hypothetical protein
VIDEDSSRNAQQLGKSLSAVPELIKTQLNDLQKQLAIDAKVSTPSVWSLALLPIVDHSSVVKEMEFISEVMNALASTTLDKVCCWYHIMRRFRISISPTYYQTKLEPIRSRAMSIKDFDMAKTSRSPMHLVPYQRLLWILEDIDGMYFLKDSTHNLNPFNLF